MKGSESSFAQAEKMSLEGNDESQDSQAIFDALKAEFGVGAVTSSAARGQPDQVQTRALTAVGVQGADVTEEDQGQDQTRPVGVEHATVKNASNAIVAGNPPNGSAKTRVDTFPPSAPDEHNDTTAVPASPSRDDPGSLSGNNAPRPPGQVRDVTALPTGEAKPPKKMDVSQQTPTQVNEGRDYDEFSEVVPSSPDATTRYTHNEPRTLQDDDTGAVNFGDLSQFGRPSSQISEDAGFENTKSEWRIPNNTSQQFSSHAQTPFKPQAAPPETPGLPKNPFGAKPGIAAPFAGTQLFGQTQFSSAVKISPTSSRPSPNLLLNSISPNIMETSPLKNRANVSSPTDIRTSSPQRLHEVPETVVKNRKLQPIQEDTPTHTRSHKEELIPESPTYHPPRSSASRQPLAHYVPMKQSQERKANDDIPPLKIASDSDSDDAVQKLDRKRRIERKRAIAAQEMEKVNFLRTSRHSTGEQPTAKKRRLMNDAAGYIAQCNGPRDSDQSKSDRSLSDGRNSQSQVIPSAETTAVESTKATPGEDTIVPEQAQQTADVPGKVNGSGCSAEEDMIPATSPIRSLSTGLPVGIPPASEPELPVLTEVVPVNEVDGDNSMETSSLPPTRGRRPRTYSKRARQPRIKTFISSSASETLPAEAEDEALADSRTQGDKVVNDETQDEAPSPEDHAEEDDTDGVVNKTPRPSRLESELVETHLDRLHPEQTPTSAETNTTYTAMATSSSQTKQSITPTSSAKTTPGTQKGISPEHRKPIKIASSEASKRSLRKRALRTAVRSESPQPAKQNLRMTRQAPRHGSESTDELQQSPSVSFLQRSLASAKSRRVFRPSVSSSHRSCRLFEGMAFAISLQHEQKVPKDEIRDDLEARIVHAGGIVLHAGFQELFQRSKVLGRTSQVYDENDPLKLLKANADCGFTALISDGHSRKVKYMQALALGLPCLAHQWITACLSKGEMVDWEPYLLCAGPSTVLGNAIRSRNLKPYSAATAKLADVIEQRPRFLDGQRLLVVIDYRKTGSETKRQYVFLAQVLGPSITRVSTAEEARKAILEHENSGCPFSWVYIDSASGTAKSVLSASDADGKKKKSSATKAWRWNIRSLDDELVIQSLILGRMVGEEEVNF